MTTSVRMGVVQNIFRHLVDVDDRFLYTVKLLLRFEVESAALGEFDCAHLRQASPFAETYRTHADVPALVVEVDMGFDVLVRVRFFDLKPLRLLDVTIVVANVFGLHRIHSSDDFRDQRTDRDVATRRAVVVVVYPHTVLIATDVIDDFDATVDDDLVTFVQRFGIDVFGSDHENLHLMRTLYL